MSPWTSKKQAAWGHAKAGKKALGGKKKVEEWDDATDWKRLKDKTTKRTAPKKRKK